MSHCIFVSLSTGHFQSSDAPSLVQQVELKADSISLIGVCDPEKYPLQKKRHTLEYLRGIAHLRPRTNTVSTHGNLIVSNIAPINISFLHTCIYCRKKNLLEAIGCSGQSSERGHESTRITCK